MDMKKALILLLFFVFCTSSFAEEFHYRTLGCAQGLSQPSAISIWQDRLGRMWFGNDVLNCYSGENTQIYRLSEYFKEIEDANIHGICGTDSVLCLLAEDQLVCFNLVTETFTLPGIHASSIYCEDSFLYYTNEGVFSKYDISQNKTYLLLQFADEEVSASCILADGKDVFLLGTSRGVIRVECKDKGTVSADLTSEHISYMFRDSRKNVWAVTRSGQVYVQKNEGPFIWQTLKNDSGIISITGDKFCMEEDAAGTIWLGTLTGAYSISLSDEETNSIIIEKHILPTSVVFALYSDRQGTFWIGSYYGDVCYFNPQRDKYTFYSTDESNPERLHGVVQGAIAFDKSGNLYVATEGSGINILSPQTKAIKHLRMPSGPHTNKIRELWYDNQYDRLFISAFMNGLFCLTPGSNRMRQLDTPILSTPERRAVEEIVPYKDNLVLLTQDGLFKMDRENLQVSNFFDNPELQELCSGIIRTIHIDEQDILWVSSFKRGLFTINLRTNEVIRMYGDGLDKGSIMPSAVMDICGDAKNGLFLATLKSGVMSYRAEKDSFISFTEGNQELLSDVCYHITISKYGTLVITSNKGVSFMYLSAKGEFSSVSHLPLTSTFPLSGLSADCGLYASPDEDLIILGGLYGLLFLTERDLMTPQSGSSLYFSSLGINGKSTSTSFLFGKGLNYIDKMVLPYNENTLSVAFASSDYLLPYNTSYEYKLEGLDEHWTRTEHRVITYNSLRPGKYKLTIRETLNPERVITLDLQIKPPLWVSIPAILLYIFLVGLALWWFIRFNRSKTILRLSLDMERREMARVEESNRNKLEFFTNISNEFRTPLTLIVTLMDRLEKDLPLSGKNKATKIKRQITRLQELITELIDFRKLEQGGLLLHVSNNNIGDFLKDLYSVFSEYAAEKEIVFKYRPLGEDLYLWYDPAQMQKVFYNLLSEVFTLTSKKEEVQISFKRRSGWIDIHISTNGCTCEPTFLESVWELKHGIGLPFSQGIIQLHKGDIKVVKENNLIVFTVSLLLGHTHFSEEEINGQPDEYQTISFDKTDNLSEEVEMYSLEDKEEETGKRLCMLLVENDDMIRKSLKDSFSLVYDVVEKPNGLSAYEYATDKVPDIILSEISIPEATGIEMCNMLKSNMNTLHIPVILLTGQPSAEQMKESVRSGADDYIVKPFDMEMLFLRCNSLVRARKSILRKYTKQENPAVDEMATNIQDQEFLKAVNRVIEENWNNNSFDTNFWSRELGIGRTRLFIQLKRVTGMTPNEYILSMKMNRSRCLLEDNSQTIAEVAYQIGFSNPAYFSKCFKKQFGITPQEYKRKRSEGFSASSE